MKKSVYKAKQNASKFALQAEKAGNGFMKIAVLINKGIRLNTPKKENGMQRARKKLLGKK